MRKMEISLGNVSPNLAGGSYISSNKICELTTGVSVGGSSLDFTRGAVFFEKKV